MHEQRSNPHRRWSNRDVLREVDRHRTRWMWGLLLGLVLAATPVAVYIHHQNACLRLSYEIIELKSERTRLLEEERRLKARLAALESLASIEEWSRGRGLVHPSPEQVVVVRRVDPEASEPVASELRASREGATPRRGKRN
jgi:hypothetical protein